MESFSEDEILKIDIMVIGDSGVGKTSIIKKYVKNQFSRTFISTIGFDYQRKMIKIDDTMVNLVIWDTAGEEKYRVVAKNYFHRSQGFIVVYDITNESSFLNISNWLEQIKELAPQDYKFVIFGNKEDLDKRKVSMEDAQKLAEELNTKFFETSCENGKNIVEGIEALVREIILIQGKKKLEKNSKKLANDRKSNKKKKCC